MNDGVDFASSSKYPSNTSFMCFTTSVNNQQMQIMIDTGAQNSFINEKYLKINNKIKTSVIPQQTFFMADGVTSFVVTGIVKLNISLSDVIISISAYITKNLCTNLLLGMDFLLQYDIELKPKQKILQFNFRNQQIIIPIDQTTHSIDCSVQSPNPQSNINNKHLNIITSSSNGSIKQYINNLLNHVTDETRLKNLQSLLFEFQSIFDADKYTVANTKLSHVIETYPHTPPVSKCYRGNPTTNNEMRLIVNKLLAAGLIRESQSSYASPALLIKKKDNSFRLVIDYKKLNAITIKDNYPLPNMEITLQTLGAGYNYFTKLDLKSGFWQLPISEKDRFKTAFVTSFGLYEWNVLPQGLRNAPPSFQRIMNTLLSSFNDFTLVYLDDIVIYSRSYDEHLIHLKKIFDTFKLNNLTLNITKCEFAKQSIEYLGHIISSTTITPLPDKIKCISLLPEPKSLAQANRFIGALSWYRKFIPQFASIASPIHAVTNLSKANRFKFKWGPEQSQAFTTLKNLIVSQPLMLHFPDDSQPILLSTDASKSGIGGVLYQDINNVRHVLYYHSELLTPAQKRYHTIELEALAIFKCINRMKHFLHGRDIIIYTDNCPLCHMMDKKISNHRVEKISLLLQEYNIKQIIHVQGKYNCLPDYLSRHPVSYDDELLDSEYGLGFQKDKSSSIQLIGAVVTRSKAKAAAHNAPSSTPQSPPSSNLSHSSSIDSSSSSSSDNSSSDPNVPFDITQIKENQANDIQIQKTIKNLKINPNLSFELKDGILYKLQANHHNKLKRKLIYIPSTMINPLLVSYHNNPLIGGHFAIHRTLSKIKQSYWWPNLKQSVINHIKSCLVCQAYNINRQKRPGYLCPTSPPDGPNQLIGIDFCGPFPITPHDNKYVLCLTDYFTKFVTALPLPTCSAQDTAEAIFKHYICIFGIPKAIITDQGTSFKNQLLSSFSELFGYHHILCTPYHPQSNGQVERFNGTFVAQIAKLTDREHNNWDDYLHAIVFAYNTGIHSSTKISPYELTFGRAANLPPDHPPTAFTFPHSHDYHHQLIRNLQYIHTTARDNIIHQQQQSKIRYDRRRNDPHYKLNDIVLTRIFTNRSKLDPRFSLSPKTIIQQRHPIYWVKDLTSSVISQVHVNDMRPLQSPTIN